MQEVAPVREYFPRGHLPEQSLVFKPDVAPNTPAGQREHVDGSVVLLFFAPGRA